MDQLDMEILGCLQENARLSASKISRKVNLSISSVLERIHRMEEQGVIQRYTAIVDQTKLGRPLMMLMGVSMASPQFYERFEEKIKAEPDVICCEYLTGNMDNNCPEGQERLDGFDGGRSLHYQLLCAEKRERRIKSSGPTAPSGIAGPFLWQF